MSEDLEMTLKVSSFRRFSQFGSATVLCTAIALSGCGGSSGGTVSGTITYNGTPLNAGTITFFGKDDKSASGSIDADGKYTVANVPVGPVKIAIRTPPPIPDTKAKDVPHVEGASAVKPIQIPPMYADQKSSDLTFTVNPGSQEFPIALK
jgi:hypothetical protein